MWRSLSSVEISTKSNYLPSIKGILGCAENITRIKHFVAESPKILGTGFEAEGHFLGHDVGVPQNVFGMIFGLRLHFLGIIFRGCLQVSSMDKTMKFDVKAEEIETSPREILLTVYEALQEKGYNPINQIVGYLLSGDPAYIPRHNNARSLIRKRERDELIEELVRCYLQHHK